MTWKTIRENREKPIEPRRCAIVALRAAVAMACVFMTRPIARAQPATPTKNGAAAESHVPVLHTDQGLAFVRTPDERFAGLPGYPFKPHYVTLDGLRLHYVDQGPRDGEVVLMLHGEPSWSYLYRKMIPVLAQAGHRAIALDLMGMGRSDKPVDLEVHTYAHHIDWVLRFIETLDLKNVTLFCQDWGGLIGLRIVGEHPQRFARVVAANTRLPVIPRGFNPFHAPKSMDIDPSKGDFNPADFKNFQNWVDYAVTAPDLRPSQIVEAFTASKLTPGEAAAYDAPYPSLVYKAAIRMFPVMVTRIQDENAPAWEALGKFDQPFLTLFGRLDPNLGSETVQNQFVRHIPGAKGQRHDHFAASHFLQEDIGETLARHVNQFMADNPLASGH